MPRCFRLLTFAVIAAGAPPAAATSLGPYTIVTLGFTDAAHTRSDGYQHSTVDFLNGAGLAAGNSDRFLEAYGMNKAGTSAWVYDSASSTITRVGFFDSDYTQSDGYQYSYVALLNNSGLAAGTSERRYNGANDGGQSAWLYDSASATTTRVGLLDSNATDSNGFQLSEVRQLNDSGLLIGNSERFSGANNPGWSAWLYDSASATTTRVGFFDSNYTRSDGYQVSTAYLLNGTSIAAGLSERFSGANDAGQSAWLYDNASATTTRVGFFDSNYTRSDGYQYSAVSQLSDSGFAAGESFRFSGTGAQDAWVYDGRSATTTRVGLFGAGYTNNQFSQVNALNNTGLAVGYSRQDSGGSSAWIYDSASSTTKRIGFFDSDYTGVGGYQQSNVTLLNNSGLAAGGSVRYNGAARDYAGGSAWVYDNASATTTRVGFFDANHTRSSDGTQFSNVAFLTNSGLAAGISVPFAGACASDSCQDAWVYDAKTHTQYSILLFSRPDGYTWTDVSFLGEDGLALGQYELFDQNDNSLGMRAFAWTASNGAVDLGSLVQGGLSAAGWSHLADAIGANGLGQIIGNGQLATGIDLPYLLQVVPEPSTALLVALGLGGLAGARRCRLGGQSPR